MWCNYRKVSHQSCVWLDVDDVVRYERAMCLNWIHNRISVRNYIVDTSSYSHAHIKPSNVIGPYMSDIIWRKHWMPMQANSIPTIYTDMSQWFHDTLLRFCTRRLNVGLWPWVWLDSFGQSATEVFGRQKVHTFVIQTFKSVSFESLIVL